MELEICIISWLELKNVFQTFEPQDEVEIEREINQIIELLLEGDEPPAHA